MQHPKLCVCEPCAFHICIPSKQLITATTVRFVTIPKKRLKIMEWGRFDMKLKLTHLMIAVQCFQFQKRILSIFLKQYVLTDESGINPVLIVNHDLISLEFKGEREGGGRWSNFTHTLTSILQLPPVFTDHWSLFQSIRISHKFFKLLFCPPPISEQSKLNKNILNSH